MALFALPAGIIGTGLALKIEETERNQFRKKKKLAAVTLIQCSWRTYKANDTLLLILKQTNPSLTLLPIKEKNAFRFVMNTKFTIAIKKFKELSRPADIKNVIDIYEHGHQEVLGRVKSMQYGLDLLITNVGINTKHIKASQSLVSRFAHVEKSIEEVDKKLNKQMKIIKQIAHFKELSTCHHIDNNLIAVLRKLDANSLLTQYNFKTRRNSQ